MNASAEFLNLLIGEWELTGQMGTTELQQAVTAQWVLERSFVELNFMSTLPASGDQPPYQAVYFIGYDEEDDTYVMHLLDTFGAGFSRVIGLGKRDGNTIPFVFHYKEGSFMNRLVWESSTQSWTFELTYEQNGQARTFATKHMTPRK